MVAVDELNQTLGGFLHKFMALPIIFVESILES